MRKLFRNKSAGFTLLELTITVLILAVVAAIAIPLVLHQVEKSKQAEAVHSLGAIRSAELLFHSLTGKFIAAADEMGIRSVLGLGVGGGFYQYKIIEADTENFLATATPIGPLENWLTEIGINKDGFIGFSPGEGGGYGSGSGGGSGGSSGGGSGGSSGGGSGGSSGGGGGGYYYVYEYGWVAAPGGGGGCTSVVRPPTNLVVTANDGWLVPSFAPFAGVIGYTIEKAEQIGTALGDWQPLVTWKTPSWEDQVQNGRTYCYKAYTIAVPPGCGQMQSNPCPMVCGSAAPNATYTAAITDGKNMLDTAVYADPADGAPSGAAEVAFLNDPDGDPTTNDAVPILFGQIQDGSLAYFNPNTGVLVVDVDYVSQRSEFIAALLAHEALHRIWDQDWANYQAGLIPAPLYGNNPDGTIRHDYSYYNEFSAFTTNAMAWQSFFPDTPAGNAAKLALYNGLDATGQVLYSNMEAAANYFLENNGTRLPFPAGIPDLPNTDVNYNKTVVEILTTVYGYDIANDY